MCEAEEALTRLVFEIELQWGAGRLDLGRLKGIAAGGRCSSKPETADQAGINQPCLTHPIA